MTERLGNITVVAWEEMPTTLAQIRLLDAELKMEIGAHSWAQYLWPVSEAGSGKGRC